MEHVTFLIVALQLYRCKIYSSYLILGLTPTNMKLDCVYPKKATIIQTSWMKNNLTHKEYIAVLHPVYGIYITDNYKGRIHFQNDSSEDSSLYFIKSTLKDVGVYCCSIQTFPDGTWEKVIKIVQPDVFEVPERQNNHVLTKPEENVTFTCPYNIGGPVQQVMWERIKVDQMDFIVLCNSLGQKSFGSDFEERALVDCTSKTSTMMVLQNVTASDFAMYRCVVTGRNKTFAMSFIVTGITLLLYRVAFKWQMAYSNLQHVKDSKINIFVYLLTISAFQPSEPGKDAFSQHILSSQPRTSSSEAVSKATSVLKDQRLQPSL
uniref:Ig-like domain-containing protein n=1 Tax=Nothoprocta perdicaria TaxID=30464 RepID=A0A8C6Z759_NOTPE